MWYSAGGCIVTLIVSLFTALLTAEAQPAGKITISASSRLPRFQLPQWRR